MEVDASASTNRAGGERVVPSVCCLLSAVFYQNMLLVNDVPLAYEPGMTVRDILRRKNYIWRMIAVFIDGELVPKAKYDTRQVPDGADVKVIHQIAGG